MRCELTVVCVPRGQRLDSKMLRSEFFTEEVCNEVLLGQSNLDAASLLLSYQFKLLNFIHDQLHHARVLVKVSSLSLSCVPSVHESVSEIRVLFKIDQVIIGGEKLILD